MNWRQGVKRIGYVGSACAFLGMGIIMVIHGLPNWGWPGSSEAFGTAAIIGGPAFVMHLLIWLIDGFSNGRTDQPGSNP
jgi:hypothetical protein